MKKIYILLSAMLLMQLVHAQGLQAGIRAGINNGTLSTEFPGVNEGTVQRGFIGGAFARASLLGFFVQPEVNFSQRKGSFEIPGQGNYTNNLNYMDMAAMFGYSLVGVVRVNAGPSFMTLLSASQKADAAVQDPNFSKGNFNSTAWGLQLGVGFDISKLCVDIRYDFNLTNLGRKDVPNPAGGTLDYSTGYSLFQFTLGYKIIKL